MRSAWRITWRRSSTPSSLELDLECYDDRTKTVGDLGAIGQSGLALLTTTLGGLVLLYAAAQRGLASLQELLSGPAGLYEDSLFLSNFLTVSLPCANTGKARTE
jgi:hypothetical protein